MTVTKAGGASMKLIGAPFTPFDQQGGLDLSAVERQAAHMRDTGLVGAFVAGTTGESASLSVTERKQLMETWRQHAGSLRLIAHVGSANLAEATELARPEVVASGITLDQITLRRVDPDAEPLGRLSDSIAALEAAGRRTAELEGKWWHKISGPLSAVLMPLLGAVAGFGLARSGHLLARAVIGMALGFAFFVVDNAALAMGSFGGYPPLLAAWAPFVLFFLLGETVLIRTEE